MDGWRLVRRSLRFYWRAHLGVALGATLATAILVGALAVGDSVRATLRAMALARLGEIRFALDGRQQFFRAALAAELAGSLGAPVAPAILTRGTATLLPADGSEPRRAGRVRIVGAEATFWRLGRTSPPALAADEVALNERLAAALRARPGEELLLRIERPSALSRDAPLSTIEDLAVPLRVRVAAIVGDTGFGRFSLEANQLPPSTAFLPLATLQRALDRAERANALLVGERAGRPLAADEVAAALDRHATLADLGFDLRPLPATGEIELRTERVFFDPAVAARAMLSGARGVLTYFVNEIRRGGRATPYSFVTAMTGPPLPSDLRDDELVINEWLARDLGARPGDRLALRYWVMGEMRRLEERRATFRVRAIVPIRAAAADRALMPDFPGLANAEDCREWRPGVPIDLSRIRPADEAYWDAYRGIPKAFLSLGAGQRLWNNRFGNLTAIRYRAAGTSIEELAARLRSVLRPADLGLFFAPVREQALAASRPQFDFGLLFLGFSLFLIVAALLLMALLFALGIEQRAEEVGTLLALGFRESSVRRWLWLEGGLVALRACAVGALLGLGYTHAVIAGLGSIWRGAVAGAAVRFAVQPATLVGGALAAWATALLAIGLVVRRQARRPARDLLARGGIEAAGESPRPSRVAARIALGGSVVATILASAALRDPERAAGIFFAVGTLLLATGLAACRWLIGRWGSDGRHLDWAALLRRNVARRPGRSLATIALLASGSFMVVAVGANRHDPTAHSHRRDSGTGGFALYVETALPVFDDLASPQAAERFGWDPEELTGVSFVPLRLREGDDASCLNLNRAQSPRILGVAPAALASRGAFAFRRTIAAVPDPWSLLDRAEPDGAIPAVGDTNTVVWALGKSLGETITVTDDRGERVSLRIVGILANSILQGALVIAESRFVERFPAHAGYQVLLVEAPSAERVRETLARGLEDLGVEIASAADRLAAFAAVEHTYLAIFALLGGLGLLLGTFGLGAVVLRNAMERRSEWALLLAVGFRRRDLLRTTFAEHAVLLALGLAVGTLAALVALLPVLLAPRAEPPGALLAALLVATLLNGAVWVAGSASMAIRGPLLAALRNE